MTKEKGKSLLFFIIMLGLTLFASGCPYGDDDDNFSIGRKNAKFKNYFIKLDSVN
jgi:hypothetical protein